MPSYPETFGERPNVKKTRVSYVYDSNVLLTIDYYAENSSYFVTGTKSGIAIQPFSFLNETDNANRSRYKRLVMGGDITACPHMVLLAIKRIRDAAEVYSGGYLPVYVYDTDGRSVAELFTMNCHDVYIDHRTEPMVPLILDIHPDNQTRKTACLVESYMKAASYKRYKVFPYTDAELKCYVTLDALLRYPYNLVSLLADKLPLLQKNPWEKLCEVFEVMYYRFKMKR